jgi:hypothetical protein
VVVVWGDPGDVGHPVARTILEALERAKAAGRDGEEVHLVWDGHQYVPGEREAIWQGNETHGEKE